MQPGHLRLIPFSEQPIVSWKNGGGTTREVAVDRHESGGGFRWRISVAEVRSDGPFSVFPGIDRTIWLLRGAGMVLSVAGEEHRLDARLAPFRFDGAAAVEARLIDGPTEDLNVMVERDSTEATSRVLTMAQGSDLPLRSRGPSTGVLLVLTGSVKVEAPAAAHRLVEGDAVLVVGDVDAHVTALDRARTDLLWCSFAPVGETG